jgi:hypothetical protein
VFVVELEFVHLEASAPLGLVPQTILERPLGVLLSDEELYRFRVVKLGERKQTHRVDPYSATRGEATVFKVSTPVFLVAVPLMQLETRSHRLDLIRVSSCRSIPRLASSRVPL